MKILFAAFAALFAMAAHAAPTAEIFAPHGCDTANIVPVMSDLNPGKILYWQNTNGGGCKADRGDTGAAGKVKPVVDEMEEVAVK